MSSHNFLTLKVPTLADIDWKCPRWQGLERNRLAAICKKTCHPKHSKHFRNLAKTWYKSFLEQLLRPLACFFFSKKTGVFSRIFSLGKSPEGRWCHPAMATDMVLALHESHGMRALSAAIPRSLCWVFLSSDMWYYVNQCIYVYIPKVSPWDLCMYIYIYIYVCIYIYNS